METVYAIDVHAHYGIYKQHALSELANGFMTGDAETVVQRALQADTECTIVSPLLGLLPRGEADAVAGNEEAHRVVAETDGLLQWVVVDPLQTGTYSQAREMLQHEKCVGIKIHPEEHRYPISEHGRKLFEVAEECGAVILTHSGESLSEPSDFVPFANDFPHVKVILAHLGNHGAVSGEPDKQVRAIQAARHGNLYTDTSSAKSILPGLVEWAVREVGAEKILYGTDTPLYFAPMQRARIDHAGISDEQRRMILRENAVALLDLKSLLTRYGRQQ